MENVAKQGYRHPRWQILMRGVFVTSALLPLSVLAMGAASAGSTPTVTGQKYSDARSALSGAGSTVVVSTTVGDQFDRDDCIVTRQQTTMVPPPENTSESATKQTSLSLNCEAPVASAIHPGFSLASPEGAAAAAAAKKGSSKSGQSGG
jgi:hypothetical protein